MRLFFSRAGEGEGEYRPYVVGDVNICMGLVCGCTIVNTSLLIIKFL